MPSSLAARDFRSDRWFLRPRYCPENQIGQAQREQPTYLRQRDLGNSAVARCQVVWLLAISDRIVGFCVLDIVRRIGKSFSGTKCDLLVTVPSPANGIVPTIFPCNSGLISDDFPCSRTCEVIDGLGRLTIPLESNREVLATVAYLPGTQEMS